MKNKHKVKNLPVKIFVFIDRFHWLWLMIAAPFMIFPSPKRSLVLLVVPGLWINQLIINKLIKREPEIERFFFPANPLSLPLLILAIMLCVSLWVTFDISFSLEKISGLILGLGIFYAIIREARNPLNWWVIFFMFLGGGFGWAVIGFLGTDWTIKFDFLAPLINNIPSMVQNFPGVELGIQHNAVGGTLLWFLPAWIVFSIFLGSIPFSNLQHAIGLEKDQNEIKEATGNSAPRNGWNQNPQRLLDYCGRLFSSTRMGKTLLFIIRVVVWLLTAFILLVLFLTQSRNSYLAFGLTVIVSLLIVSPPKWRRWLIALFIVIAVVSFTAVQKVGGWDNMMLTIGFSDQAGFSIDTLAARMEIWSRAIFAIQDFPFSGMGMDTFRKVVHELYPLFTISHQKDIAHAHNEFLQTALDLGIPGLIAFISIYLILFGILVKTWWILPRRFSPVSEKINQIGDISSLRFHLARAMILGLGGGLFSHLVFGISDAITLGAKPGIFYWMLLGLVTTMDGTINDDNYPEMEIPDQEHENR
jgi:putative inorganic carbon (HCO3(-)) transporter